jgi:hypothetical protein
MKPRKSAFQDCRGKRREKRVEKEHWSRNWDEEYRMRRKGQKKYIVKKPFHSFESGSAQLFRE